MQREKRGFLRHRPIKHLLLSIGLVISFCYFIFAYSPHDTVLGLPLFFLFYLLLFLLFFSITTYLFKNSLHGVLVGCVVVVFFLFRQTHLTHPFFLIMLLALFLTVELLLVNKK